MEESCVPPGFRFHPTEEELVGYYLARKVASQNIDLDIIQEVDLYRIEPWDLQGRCKYGHDQEQKEWYFFSYKDRKYPSGTRTNRATVAGFWKATGRDKPVVSGLRLIGMRKTLVFYRGRAPNGRKTDWIIHEYRLQSCNRAPAQEEGWVVCRAFQKPSPNHQRPFFPNYYQEHSNAVPSYISGTTTDQFMEPHSLVQYSSSSSHCGSENFEPKAQFFDDVPQLESPEIGYNIVQRSGNLDHGVTQEQAAPSATTAIDWNFLDSLLHEHSSSKNSY